MTMLEQALVAGHVILSSAGAHAREDWHKIITRKRADIARANHTVWVVNSNATRPETVQSFCNDHDARYVIFVSRFRDSKANSGPSTANRANEYSSDGKTRSRLPFWPKDPKGLSEVTGRINRATAGFWFDALEEIDSGEIDLRSYSKLNGELLDGFQKHESAYPARRIDTVRRRGYQVLAVGRLASPFVVSLRSEGGTPVRESLAAQPLRRHRRAATGRQLAKGAGASVSVEDHVAYADPPLQPVLRELVTRIKALDPSLRRINEHVTMHQRIAYSVARIFVELKVQREQILVRFFGMGVSDPTNLITNIPATHRWQHDKQIAVDSLDLVGYVMTFVEASYRSRLTTMPVR